MVIYNYDSKFNAVIQKAIVADGELLQEKVVKAKNSFTQSKVSIDNDGVFIQLLEISNQIKLWDSFAEANLTEEGIKARLKEVLEDK